MTRINTNISALTAEQNLTNSNNQLQTTLTRLSTGLRINSAADDPAGMIAATDLGSNIAASNQAISNSQVASQMISTADSALSQISSLLTTINGLVTQAANTSSESSSQIAANQLQIDSSLSAINSIAQTTTFQGQNLLDGSLAFKTVGTSGELLHGRAETCRSPRSDFAARPTGAGRYPRDQHGHAGHPHTGPWPPPAPPRRRRITFGDSSTLAITAPTGGTAGNGITVNFNETANQAAGTASAAFNASTNVLTINVSTYRTGDNRRLDDCRRHQQRYQFHGRFDHRDGRSRLRVKARIPIRPLLQMKPLTGGLGRALRAWPRA